MDLISIIIPVYNTGKYLEGCLESCLKQTYTNIEIIVIDDHSTDPLTLDTLDKFKQRDPRMKIFHLPENRGQGYCRNKGLEYIQGKYFTYIDSDDTFVPHALERLHEAMLKYNTDFVMSDVQNIDDDEVLVNMLGNPGDGAYAVCKELFNFKEETDKVYDIQEMVRQCRLFNIPAVCYAKLFNTQAYLDSGVLFNDGPYSRHSQDEDWSTHLYLKLKTFAYVKFVCIVRFLHRNSASAPSLDYYRCGLTACHRRYLDLLEPQLPAFYKKSVFQFAIDRTKRLLERSESPEQTAVLADFAYTMFKEEGHAFLCPNFANINVDGKDMMELTAIRSQAYKDTPSLLYFSLQNLLDVSDPDTSSIRTMLEHLSAHRFEVNAVSAGLISKVKGDQLCEQVYLASKQNQSFNHQSQINKMPIHGINYFSPNLSHKYLEQLSLLELADLSLIKQVLLSVINEYQPDIVMFSGQDQVTLAFMRFVSGLNKPIVYLPYHVNVGSPVQATQDTQVAQAALAAQASLAYKLAKVLPMPANVENAEKGLGSESKLGAEKGLGSENGLGSEKSTDAENGQVNENALTSNVTSQIPCALTVTFDKNCTQDPAAKALGYIPHPSWVYRNLDQYVTNQASKITSSPEIMQKHKQGAITIIAPTLDNSLGLLIALVSHYQALHPEQRFVFVSDTANSLPSNLQKLHDQDGRNLTAIKPDLRNLKLQAFNYALDNIWADTKVLISLPHSNVEAFNAICAAWQGIKVLTTPQLATSLQDYVPQELQAQTFKGVALPQSVLQDPTYLPNASELAPFVQALEELCATPHQALTTEQQCAYVHRSLQNWDEALCQLLPPEKQGEAHAFYRLD